MCALRRTDSTAPLVANGVIGSRLFRARVGHFLSPVSRKGGTVVACDLSAHQACNGREALEARGAMRLYL